MMMDMVVISVVVNSVVVMRTPSAVLEPVLFYCVLAAFQILAMPGFIFAHSAIMLEMGLVIAVIMVVVIFIGFLTW